MSKYCPQCGTMASDDSNFCWRCGLDFRALSANPFVPSRAAVRAAEKTAQASAPVAAQPAPAPAPAPAKPAPAPAPGPAAKPGPGTARISSGFPSAGFARPQTTPAAKPAPKPTPKPAAAKPAPAPAPGPAAKTAAPRATSGFPSPGFARTQPAPKYVAKNASGVVVTPIAAPKKTAAPVPAPTAPKPQQPVVTPAPAAPQQPVAPVAAPAPAAAPAAPQQQVSAPAPAPAPQQPAVPVAPAAPQKPVVDVNWKQNTGVVNPNPVATSTQYNPTFHCRCEYCGREIDYHTYDIGHRTWYPQGFIYCPQCQKPLRHKIEYEVLTNVQPPAPQA